MEREVTTSDNKRIDLVVDCADFRVCIENKIYADLNNDLGHYRQHCEKDSNERPILGIVLSPYGVTSPELRSHHFVSITYEDLVKQVRQLMGSHIGPHNTQYQYLLFDFLEQTSRFSRTTKMNDDEQAFLDFWKQNDKEINNLVEWTQKMWERLDANTLAKAHREHCLKLLSEPEKEIFRDWTWEKRVAVFDLKQGRTIDGSTKFLHVEFHPLRVTHVFGNGNRGGPAPNALARKINDRCGTRFQGSPTQSNYLEFATEESPFNDSACENAVKTSVDILKYIAERCLPDKT